MILSADTIRLTWLVTLGVVTLVSGSTIDVGFAWVVTVKMVNVTVLT